MNPSDNHSRVRKVCLMTEEANHNEQAEVNNQQPQAASEQPAAQQAPAQPQVQPQQPQVSQSPAQAQQPQAPASPEQPMAPQPPASPAQPQAQQQPSEQQQVPPPPAQPQNPQEQQNQQNPQDQQQPTFRENGAFSFFATPSDPDDDPTPMSVGFKIGWFVLGLIGGMLGLFMAWLSTSTLSQKRRRQALIWTWAGFAVQAIIFFIVVLSGGTLPGMPSGGSTAQSASSAGAGSTGTGSTSAFG